MSTGFLRIFQDGSDEANSFFETIVYLDTEQLSGTYSGLTGSRAARVEVKAVGGSTGQPFFSPRKRACTWQTYEISDTS